MTSDEMTVLQWIRDNPGREFVNFEHCFRLSPVTLGLRDQGLITSRISRHDLLIWSLTNSGQVDLAMEELNEPS